MANDVFLVAAGGTGMRCLQSVVNMAAMGLFPGKTVNILLLETDEENKDKRNTENLLSWYKQIQKSKSTKDKDVGDDELVGEYFSANINLHTFVPDYSTDATRNFVVLSQVERGDSEINRKLANIFYEEPVQEFNLAHGYRAQTHLGSYLMYHAIIQEIRLSMKDDDYRAMSQLFTFIERIMNASKNGYAKVFALGSSFGGTGASSVPVITRAITHSCKILNDDKIEMSKILYGGVVLSNYFSFKPATDSHKKKDKVVAESTFFQHNSASALMYYVNDPTILSTYKRMYLLGWGNFKDYNVDLYKENVLKIKNNGEKVATGGKKQSNPAHFMEFFGALAAKHFFDERTSKSSELESISKTQFKFKSLEAVNEDGNFKPIVKFEDLYSIPNDVSGKTDGNKSAHEMLRNNVVGFLSLSSLVAKQFEGSSEGLLNDLGLYNSRFNISLTEKESLDQFLAYFVEIPVESGSDQNNKWPGWFRQLYETFHGVQGNPAESFLGLSSDSLTGTLGWYQNYAELAGDEKKALDKFVGVFKKANGNTKDGNLSDLLSQMRNAFYQLTVVDKLNKENKELNK